MPEERKVRVGVLGVGYMGANHARILSSMPGVELVGAADSRAEKAVEVAEKYGGAAFSEPGELIESVEALIVAVPTELHHQYALQALQAGLDVLVEKPITDSLERADELISAAGKTGRILQVGHVERYNPVCLELPRLVEQPVLFTCERLSPYIPSWVGNTGVVLDLMIHDLDVVLGLVDSGVERLEAFGRAIRSETEDLAAATVSFEGGALAVFVSSRVSQTKVRRITVTQPGEYISADLLRQNIAVHHFVSSDYFFDERMGFKQETVTEIPYLSRHGEPLRLELEAFLESVVTRKPPLVGGAEGRLALALALAVMEKAGLSR